jgi:hypothetical protein
MTMPAEVRIEMLAQHVERLAELLGEEAAANEEACVENPAAKIRLNGAEVARLKSAAGSLDTTEAEPRLLVETLALILKTNDDVGDFRTAAAIDPELEGRVRESLAVDSQLAESLAADIGALIDKAVETGERTTAVRLGDFRLAVRQQVAYIRRALDGEAAAEETTADEQDVQTEDTADPQHIADDATESDERFEKSKRRYAKLKHARAKEQRTRQQMKRLRILLAVLGAAVTVGTVALFVQLIPALNPPDATILTIDDFAEVPMVISVEAKPPSLFVRIDGPHWRSVSKERRMEIIRDVGRIVVKADYNGARFRDDNSALVGEFIRGVGSYEFPPQSLD